jgi:septum formation topological specificity factor MinE
LFKSETSDAQQIIVSAFRGSSVTLKRTILEIFQEYFAIEEHKVEILEGKDKEDVDLSSDIGVLTGTAKNVNTDE